MVRHSDSPSLPVVVHANSVAAKGALGVAPDLNELPINTWIVPLVQKMLAGSGDSSEATSAAFSGTQGTERPHRACTGSLVAFSTRSLPRRERRCPTQAW